MVTERKETSNRPRSRSRGFLVILSDKRSGLSVLSGDPGTRLSGETGTKDTRNVEYAPSEPEGPVRCPLHGKLGIGFPYKVCGSKGGSIGDLGGKEKEQTTAVGVGYKHALVRLYDNSYIQQILGRKFKKTPVIAVQVKIGSTG